MTNKIISKVTSSERDELKRLIERKNGIIELLKIDNIEKEEVYERIIEDLSHINSEIDNWWIKMSKQYQWETHENGQWEINFDECLILSNIGS